MGRLFEPTFSLFEDKQPLNHLNNLAGMEALNPEDYSKRNSIFLVCDDFGKDLVIDNNWAKTLQKFVYVFTTRKEGITDYMEFFGSPYVGLHKVSFTTRDRNEWFSEIFDIDEHDFKDSLLKSKSLSKDWKVVSDVFNITIPYLLYRVFNSKLDPKTKQQALTDIVCMYHYKCLTSIHNNDYPFIARREVSVETYNRLSMKYDIKRYGSWKRLIEARAEVILDKAKGIHYNTFTKMDDDKKIIYMVGDIQDRLRGVFNDINKVFHDVKNKTDLVSFEASKVNLADGLALKHTLKDEIQFKNYIEQTIISDVSFYKEELINHAVKDMGYAPVDKLKYIVENFPALYNSRKGSVYVEFINEIIVHLFDYLHVNKINRSSLYEVLIRMRGTYNSKRGNSKELIYLRDTGDKLVRDLTGIKTPVTVAGLRTAFLLYVVLRTLTKEHYS